MKLISFFFTLSILCLNKNGSAQAGDTATVFLELKKMDSLLFEEGFNKCNLVVLEQLLHKDLKFMHDQNGMQNGSEFLQGFKESICQNTVGKPIRKLVAGSMAVYPMYHEGKLYGAVQMGLHEFFMKEPGQDALRFTVNGKFTTTWLLVAGAWKMHHAISYDHQQPKKYAAMFEDDYPFPLFDNDRQIEGLLQKLKIPSLSIGYINGGKLQQIRAFGETKPGIPISNNSIYKVASLAKPITALVTLKLIEAGLWQLDEPLSNYFIDPAIKGHPFLKKLTTRTVLSHQSGLPNWRYLREDKKLLFEFEPGTKFQYAGEGFEYLRKALEKKFGKTLEQLADELLYRPLKMQDTHFYWTKTADASRYAVESDKEGQPIAFEKHVTTNAAANLLTTVEDYSKFLIHVLEGAGLSPRRYTEFISPQATMQAGIHWGLGMQVFPDLPGNEFALVHTGGDFGIKCIAILLPQSKRGLVLFTNAENGLRIWKKVIEEYLGPAGKEIVRRNLE